MTLGEKLTELRIAKGWTKATLSYNARVTPHTIGRLERDEVQFPSMNVIVALSDALGVDTEEWVPYIREYNKKEEEK